MSEIALNKEILTTLESCKDAHEIVALAKTKGITLSEEQANKIFNATHNEELSDEEMDIMVGGGGCHKDDSPSCSRKSQYPNCDLCDSGHYCASNTTYGD